MLVEHAVQNNLNYAGSGLEVSVDGLDIIIAAGTFICHGCEYMIPKTTYTVKPEPTIKFVNIYLVENQDTPLILTEEWSEHAVELNEKLIMNIVSFYLLPETTDLNDLNIDIIHYI